MPPTRAKKLETEVSRMLTVCPYIVHYYHPVDIPPGRLEKFTPRRPVDFYAFQKGGRGLVLECKAVKSKSLGFSRFADHQWQALVDCALGGVDTFALVNFYGWPGRDGQRGHLYAVPVLTMHAFRETANRVSWPGDWLRDAGRELKKVRESWVW